MVGPIISRRARWAAVGFVAVALLPLVAVALATIDQWSTYRAIADDALIELQTREIGARAVLLGPYSRFGWYHPGPALFYVLAVPYRVLGSSLIALPLTAIALNGASIVAIGWIGRRRGGLVLMTLLLVGTVLLLGGLGGAVLRDVWNPTITVLPLVVLVLVVWSAVEGDRWALPAGAAIGSFLVQSHVGYAGAVGLLAVWGLVGTVLAARGSDRSVVPTLGATLAVAAVMWFLPLVEQFTTQPGNLGLVLQFAREPEAPQRVLRDGWHVVARALSWRVPWVTGDAAVNPFIGEVGLSGPAAVPVGMLVLVAGGVLAAVRRAWSAVRLDATVAILLVAAVFTFGRLSGPMYPYLVVWVWGGAMLAWVAIAWSVWSAVPEPARDRVSRGALVVIGSALVVVSLAVTVDVASVDVASPDQVAATRRFSAAAREAVGDGPGPVLVDALGGLRPRSIAVGMALELERNGIPIEVPAEAGLAYGPRWVDDDGRSGARLLVTPPPLLPATREAAGAELLARARLAPLPGETAGEVVALYRLVAGRE